MGLRILNRNFTKDLENKSSTKYKEFVKFFKDQLDIVYKNLDGYVGVEIIEVFNGSVRVRFRVIIVVSIKSKIDSVTGKRVTVTQLVVKEAETGWVQGLRVDKDPASLELGNSPAPSPENVTVVEKFKDGAEIAWDAPLYSEYYSIKGYFIEHWVFGSKEKVKTETLSGQRTRLQGLASETSHVARIVAENKNGVRGLESKNIDIKTIGGMELWLIAVIVVICIVFLIVIIVLIILCCRRKNSSEEDSIERHSMKRFQEEGIEKVHPKSYVNTMYGVNDKCQNYAREDLVLQHELGSGEFGVVHKGQLMKNGEPMECAVKTLKGHASPEDYRELCEELDIMANVGFHPHLVNLIGSCLEDEKLFVIVEFARNGSLIEFVRKARTEPEVNPEFELNYINRLGIALDVAKGMTYLATKRCVHRDIAARNILLADNYVAKVADFGLSRDIYETGEYEKTTGGKLPIKWMAIESLELRRFTLETDVWSFGVLLWEIETKGLMPHGAIRFNELLKKQKKGYRLEKPTGTPDELYRLMQMCWQGNPQRRPTFAQICNTLEVILGNNQVAEAKPNQDDVKVKHVLKGKDNEGHGVQSVV